MNLKEVGFFEFKSMSVVSLVFEFKVRVVVECCFEFKN